MKKEQLESKESNLKRAQIVLPQENGIYDLEGWGETGVRYVRDEQGFIQSVVLVNHVFRGSPGRATQDGVRKIPLSWRGRATEQLTPSLYLDIILEEGKIRSNGHRRAGRAVRERQEA